MSNVQTVFRSKKVFDIIRIYVTGNRRRLVKIYQPGVSIVWGKFLSAILDDPVIRNFMDHWDLGCIWWAYQCHPIEVFKSRKRIVINHRPHQPRRVRYELKEGFDAQEWINCLPRDPYTYQVTASIKRSISNVDGEVGSAW